jgi:acetyl esterase/lipase
VKSLGLVGLLAFSTAAYGQASPVPFAAVADSARRAPAADHRIAYGKAAPQFAELRLPRGAGPHPVVVLIHGGCWLNAYGLDHVDGIAESMRQRGLAVYSIEYRRVGDEGAGLPGTFRDVRAAFDTLQALAPRHALNLSRVVLMGHSAGGHLALWLGSEPGVRVRGIVALAAVTDLAAFATPTGCGSAVLRLMGGAPSERRAEYTSASPLSRRGPAEGTSVVLIRAEADRIVPASQADAYAERFPRTGVLRVPGGHFDLVAPWTEAWAAALRALDEMLSPP